MNNRQEQTRTKWLEILDKCKYDANTPANDQIWSPRLECASRDELTNIQNAKLKVVTPFLYENSDFYKQRFDRLGLIPSDIQSLDDLHKWPVIDKKEMI